jgi:hypothetical protein
MRGASWRERTVFPLAGVDSTSANPSCSGQGVRRLGVFRVIVGKRAEPKREKGTATAQSEAVDVR